MRIAYLVHWTGGLASGVTRKIVGQIAAWRAAGADARVFAYGRPAVVGLAEALAGEGIPVASEPFASGWRRAGAIWRITALASRFAPDLAYWRHDLWHPSIEHLARRVPLVVEVNTDDAAEVRLGRARRRLFHLATRDRLLRTAAGAVFVSEELSRNSAFACCRGLRRVIPNGIVLSDVVRPTPPSSGKPGIVFVLSEDQPWQGLDKLVWLAGKRPQWRFTVVGGIPPTGRQGAPENLRFVGTQGPARLAETLAVADVGIGSLALHRKAMEEASPLKVREYLAAGLPVIIGYRDSDFPAGAPFLLDLPNREDNIVRDIARVDAFIAEWKGRRVPREAIRHLDTRRKEADRMAFFRQVTGMP